MSLVVVLRAAGFYRYVEGVVKELIDRGWQVSVVTADPAAVRLDHPKVRNTSFAAYQMLWARSLMGRLLFWMIRDIRSYAHWVVLDVQSDVFLRRWHDWLPGPTGGVFQLLGRMGFDLRPVARHLERLCRWLEQSHPPDRRIVQQIASLRPSLVVLTPQVFPRSSEVEYLKAARQLGLPTVTLIPSWDNLPSKGAFHVAPDYVMVWNQTQVLEAGRFHQLPESRVVAVGAPVFDYLFSDAPRRPRPDFCRQAGLNPMQPYILYAASSPVRWEYEWKIVAELRWQLCALAGSADTQILVRPHPKLTKDWAGFELEGVRVWSTPGFPTTEEARSGLWNSIYHAEAVVGLSTSVFLEAAILDRPALTLLTRGPDSCPLANTAYYLHFQSLLTKGLLIVVEDEEAAARQLLEIMSGRDDQRAARRAFVESFLRPHGLEIPAARVAADFLQKVAAGAPARPVPQPAAPAEFSTNVSFRA